MALLDFDVHHGNGTQACIRNTAPGLATHTFETPYSKGVQEFPVWKPWLDITDAENIFFARSAPHTLAPMKPASVPASMSAHTKTLTTSQSSWGTSNYLYCRTSSKHMSVC